MQGYNVIVVGKENDIKNIIREFANVQQNITYGYYNNDE